MEINDLIDKISRDLFLEAPLTPQTYRTIADFTFLWSVYEGRIFGEDYNNILMRRKVDEGLIRLTDLGTYWTYFRDRYLVDDSTVNETFAGLSFGRRNRNAENRLREIITNPSANDREKTEAILVIVNRLRNNLFHDIKKVHSYNMQRNNLEMASTVLLDVLSSVDLYRPDLR